MGTFAPQSVYSNTPSPQTGAGLAALASNQEAIMELPGAQAPQNIEINDNALTFSATPVSAFLIVDTEGQAADDLEVINPIVSAADNLHDGMLLYLQAADAGRVVTVKNSSSANGILTADGNDVVLNTVNWYCLRLQQGTWREVADLRSIVVANAAQTTANNAASAAAAAQSTADAAAAAAATAATTTALGRARLATTAEVQAGAAAAGSPAPAVLRPEDIAAFPAVLGGAMLYNTREVLTVSGTWIAPVTGWIRAEIIGGGAGGNYCSPGGSIYTGGGGGGAGGHTVIYVYVTKNQQLSYTVGAGGIAAASNNTYGSAGGNSTFAGHSAGGGQNSQSLGRVELGRLGGTSESGLEGAPGHNAQRITGNYYAGGGKGGGSGYGAGGMGASFYSSGNIPAENGHNGAIILEYFDHAKAA